MLCSNVDVLTPTSGEFRQAGCRTCGGASTLPALNEVHEAVIDFIESTRIQIIVSMTGASRGLEVDLRPVDRLNRRWASSMKNPQWSAPKCRTGEKKRRIKDVKGRGGRGGGDREEGWMDGCELFIRALLLSLFRWPVLITSCRRWNRFFVSQLGIIKRKSNEFLLLLPPPSTPPFPSSISSSAELCFWCGRFSIRETFDRNSSITEEKSVGINEKRTLSEKRKGRGGEEEEETRTN